MTLPILALKFCSQKQCLEKYQTIPISSHLLNYRWDGTWLEYSKTNKNDLKLTELAVHFSEGSLLSPWFLHISIYLLQFHSKIWSNGYQCFHWNQWRAIEKELLGDQNWLIWQSCENCSIVKKNYRKYCIFFSLPYT